MKILKSIFQWLAVLAFLFGIWAAFHYGKININSPSMPGTQVLFFALSLAFAWVEVFKIGVVKPFTCVKCMTGWFALLLAVLYHAQFWALYLPAGLFVGAMFENFRMRWL